MQEWFIPTPNSLFPGQEINYMQREVTARPVIHNCGLDTVLSTAKTTYQFAAGPRGDSHQCFGQVGTLAGPVDGCQQKPDTDVAH